MAKIYAAHSDCGHISESETIRAFDTEDDARAWLLDGFGDEWDRGSAVFGAGYFSDAWFKLHREPEFPADDKMIAPFAADEVVVQRPGQHPGGRQWWVTPYPEVLTLLRIEEIQEPA